MQSESSVDPMCLLKKGRTADADAWARARLKVAPDDLEAFSIWAAALQMTGRMNDAISVYEAGLRIDGAWPVGLSNLGNAFYRAGDFDRAAPLLEKLVDVGCNTPESDFMLATSLLNLHTADALRRAREPLERSVAANPENPEAWHLLGRILANAGDFTASEDAMQRSIALRADIPTLLEFAMHQACQNKFAEALRTLDQAVLVGGETPDIVRRQERLQLALRDSRRRRRRAVTYPWHADHYKDTTKLIDDYVLAGYRNQPELLHSGTRAYTFGSCFATNVHAALTRLGIDSATGYSPEALNNTYANRRMFEWLTGEYIDEQVAIGFEARVGSRETTRQRLESAEVVVFTLGLAAAFFNKVDGSVYLGSGDEDSTIASSLSDYQMRTTSVAENVSNIDAIVALVHSINPTCHIFLTLSPVPLEATAELDSPVIADCLSKATLRLAIDAVLASWPSRVHYWPSFEIVRWLSPHVGPAFGADGNFRHVNEDVVQNIMRAFVNTYGDAALRAKVSGSALASN